MWRATRATAWQVGSQKLPHRICMKVSDDGKSLAWSASGKPMAQAPRAAQHEGTPGNGRGNFASASVPGQGTTSRRKFTCAPRGPALVEWQTVRSMIKIMLKSKLRSESGNSFLSPHSNPILNLTSYHTLSRRV